MRKTLGCAALAFAAALFLPHPTQCQIAPPRERLGIRTGYIGTFGKLGDNFGGGGHLTLHFAEEIVQPVYLDIRIGAIYLGDTHKPEIPEAVFGAPVQSEMRILFFSVGPQVAYSPPGDFTFYAAAGGGVYSVSILTDTGVEAYDFSDQHFGFNGGLGVLWRFVSNWNAELNITSHKFWTSARSDDLYYVFTEGDMSPFLYEVSVGATMDLR